MAKILAEIFLEFDVPERSMPWKFGQFLTTVTLKKQQSLRKNKNKNKNKNSGDSETLHAQCKNLFFKNLITLGTWDNVSNFFIHQDNTEGISDFNSDM